jgi:uncharacterized protein (TIGR02145 family)
VAGGEKKNPCPCGYHVPSDEDMKTLERYLGMSEEEINSTNYGVMIGEKEGVGAMLKSKTGWDDYLGISGNGTDLYGFNLLPAGYIDESGEQLVGKETTLWTTSANPSFGGNMTRSFSNESKGIYKAFGGYTYRGSIRCIKN